MNELNQWLSAIRKVSIYNERMLPSFHPGAHRSGKWTCCLQGDRAGNPAIIITIITSDASQTLESFKAAIGSCNCLPWWSLSMLIDQDSESSFISGCVCVGCFSVTGCSRTHSAVTLGDWSDPLDPDVETQTIFKQLLQGRDKLRSEEATVHVKLKCSSYTGH